MPGDLIKPVVENYDGTLNGYQAAAQGTAIYPGRNTFLGLMYVTGKTNGEAGELAEKVFKLLRDGTSKKYSIAHGTTINSTPISEILTIEEQQGLIKELGDILWYVAAAAQELGYSLSYVAEQNLEKLASRAKRGTLSGSGDER